jgi:hypothetical protein
MPSVRFKMPRFDRPLIQLSMLMLGACSLELPGSGPVNSATAELDGGSRSAGGSLSGGSSGSGRDGESATQPDAALGEPDAAAASCSMDGRYAVEVRFEVSWVGTQFASIVPVISPGEGELSFVVIGELREGATATELSFRACQASVPQFVSTLPQEHYAVRFSDTVWDNPGMPVYHGEATRCREPGCTFQSTPIHALIGSALSDPLASWPTSASAGQWPDHDGDGRPGVAAFMLGPNAGGSIEYPPVDLFGIRRVQKLDLGMRVNLTLDGKREGCDKISGDVQDGSIDTRALDCVAVSRPMRCTSDELRFLDDNLPAWTVRQGTFRGTRVSDDAECEDVRQLFGFGQAAP